MSLDMVRFARTNRVILIWVVFAALLYLFRDLFGLVFITFIMCFLTHSITTPLERAFKLNRRPLVVFVYLLFLGLVVGFLFFLAPTLLREGRNFTEQLPRALHAVNTWVETNAADSFWMPQVVDQIQEYLTPEQMILKGWDASRKLMESGLQYASWFFVGLVFSFLIMLDLPRTEASVKNLRNTRLAAFYTETADSVVLFAKVVGENFRAQILVSLIGTVLLGIGLYLLGLENIALLCTLSFFCGLIPILGVLISSVPIVLMAVNHGGVSLGLWALVIITAVSLIETYVLNPRIVSAVMNINPVMTIIILYIAYSIANLWGVLLGIPVSAYIYRQLVVPGKSAVEEN